MIERILVPLDGSRFGESALPAALALSRRTGAALRVITVIEPIPHFAYEGWDAAAQAWGESYLGGVVERIGDAAGGEVTTRIAGGHVAETLESEAEAWAADLVVMASHGRGPFSRAWLGSVADAYVHLTHRPVLLLRPDDSDAPVDLAVDFVATKVLVPLDGTDAAEEILKPALDLGGLFGAAYRLVRAVPFPSDLGDPYVPHVVQTNPGVMDEIRKSAATYLDEQAAALREQGVTADGVAVISAGAAGTILEEAESSGCDLIAMSTHGRAGLARALLGSTTDKVLRGTHLPLLLQRHD